MRTACDYGYAAPKGDTPTAETRARAVWEDFEGRLRYGPAVAAIAAAITAAEERGYQRAICQRSRMDHEAGRQAGIREVARETEGYQQGVVVQSSPAIEPCSKDDKNR